MYNAITVTVTVIKHTNREHCCLWAQHEQPDRPARVGWVGGRAGREAGVRGDSQWLRRATRVDLGEACWNRTVVEALAYCRLYHSSTLCVLKYTPGTAATELSRSEGLASALYPNAIGRGKRRSRDEP